MKKSITMLLAVIISGAVCFAQTINTKVIDGGGRGKYMAVAVSDETLPDFCIYRPVDLKEAFPVIVFGNGGCRNFSVEHEHLLSELASHGYILIAIGLWSDKSFDELSTNDMERMKKAFEELQKSSVDMSSIATALGTQAASLLHAVDWITAQAVDKNSEYFGKVDMDHMAVMGQSCGGLQALSVAYDRRFRTALIMNSGIGRQGMMGYDQDLLKNLHMPVFYEIGGPDDIAYVNAASDFDAISHVPVYEANIPLGHTGDWKEPYGGKFAQMALLWFDWQLKGDSEAARIFSDSDYAATQFPEWTFRSKN